MKTPITDLWKNDADFYSEHKSLVPAHVCGQIEKKLTAVTEWIEKHHPECFKEGLWDAINKADE
jgi:hypothetical protein